MARPPTLEDHEARIKALEVALQEIQNERRDISSLQKRFFTESKADISTMLSGAVTFVEKSVAALSKDLVPRFEVLERAANNSEAERERRKLKDEGAEEQRLRDAAAKKLIADEAEEREIARERTHKRRLAVAGVVVAILTIIAGLITAAISSHH